MNVPTATTLQTRPQTQTAFRTPVSTRREHRERDFGIGYGSSSGYGFDRRYTRDWPQPLFRCH